MHRLLALGCSAALLIAAPLPALSPSEQFRQGRAAFAESCANCHGESGRGGPGYANPIWGQGAQIAKYRTAAGLFEYHQLMMPFDDPTQMTDEVKWAVTLFVLANHGVVQADSELGPAEAAGLMIR